MNEIGRLCIKLAGRDAGKTCVIVDRIDNKTVLIDGQTRRRNCNVVHLEPLSKTISIKKGASTAEIKKEFEKLGLVMVETKPKTAGERPRKLKQKKIVLEEPAKKEAKKEKKPSKKAETSEN
jgi:large subunit ribosomal protein L14e